MPAPTQPALTINLVNAAIPGSDVVLAYGACTAAGTDSSSYISPGPLSGKVKSNIFRPEYGKIVAPIGRVPLGHFFANMDLFFEGALVENTLLNQTWAQGRDTTGLIVSSGTTPNIEKKLGISPAAGVLKQWQVIFDLWAPNGNVRRIQLFRCNIMRTGDEEIEQGAQENLPIPFKVVPVYDAGAKAAGLDPIGYAHDLGQTA